MSASLLSQIHLLVLLAVGLPLNCAAGLVSFWRRSVDAGGAFVGAALGTVVFVAAGPLLWLIMAAFVLSSSAFTRFRASEKEWLASIQEKGGRRDMFQVLANGGVGMIMALLARLTGEPAFAFALTAAFASANADTWASELGVLSRRGPISLVTFRPVPRGVSGGVTLAGLTASVCGALFIALIFALENALHQPDLARIASLAGLAAGAGVFGSLVDSLLGCTLQAQYETAVHGPTERKITSGTRNTRIGGLPFVTNDVVNLLSTACAAAAGILLSRFVPGT